MYQMCNPHGIFSCTLGNGCSTEHTMFYVGFCVTFRGVFPTAPRHLVGNLPPYTNVSLKMILTNPEGRKESDETIIQTDEDGGIDKAHYLHCILGPLNVCFRSFFHIIKFALILTVPGAVPSQSLRATPFEDRILLYWKEPSEPNGIIIQYEVP